jgi:enhancing lycopene biosynthesis protein 2
LPIFDSKVEECEVDEVCVDKENKVVTTPAFMYDATFAQVGESI